MTSTQPHHNGRHAKPEPPRAAPSLPLAPEHPLEPSQVSLGELVRDATTHLSTLIRSEVELAKAELTAEVRKGIKGSVMFILALAILVFSLFFLFIALGELLAVWLPRWAAFGIVFGTMLLAAAGCALYGWQRVRSVSKPERTITTVRETGAALTHLRSDHEPGGREPGGHEPGHLPTEHQPANRPPGNHPPNDRPPAAQQPVGHRRPDQQPGE